MDPKLEDLLRWAIWRAMLLGVAMGLIFGATAHMIWSNLL